MLGAPISATPCYDRSQFLAGALIGGLGVGLMRVVLERFILRRLAGNEQGQVLVTLASPSSLRPRLGDLDRRPHALAAATGAAPAAAGSRLCVSDLSAGGAGDRAGRRARALYADGSARGWAP